MFGPLSPNPEHVLLKPRLTLFQAPERELPPGDPATPEQYLKFHLRRHLKICQKKGIDPEKCCYLTCNLVPYARYLSSPDVPLPRPKIRLQHVQGIPLPP